MKSKVRSVNRVLLSYLLEGITSLLFSDRWSTEFRNEVIHKGRIPACDDVVQFGQRITNFIP
jgi:hypothetical protein